ncbi:L,D-transpeptidase [Lactococcus lactis subsp. lactis]|uniref:L,D-transpeptidase n=1 Tax=Lactococcus lactis TaxID=1358 RepID=UPI002A8375C6|nr:L,D-transpeptidase [Lactococcus lactis]MDY4364269.1 L,D-transpeptidase [Lactococcus lactis subsp. lactis]
MKKNTTLIFLSIVALSLTACSNTKNNSISSKTEGSTITKKQVVSKKIIKTKRNMNVKMRDKTGDYWKLSSEVGDYPDLTKFSNLSLEVSISKNITYLKSNGNTIYTFYSSAGIGNTTPTGVFAIQSETSPSFYNSEEREGANYAVSWLDHGTYLFHSVPIDSTGNYLVSEAEKLGKSPGSHGCVRLSISDSNWLYEQALSGALPVGTPVTINQ